MTGTAAATEAAKTPAEAPQRQVLHVGCGPLSEAKLHGVFRQNRFREVRLDIDPGVKPDIVASLTDMRAVPDGSMDALWSSHNVEHLYSHEVPVALREFVRVLKPGGFAMITLPDLQAVARLIADDRLTEPAYTAPAGPITPLDIVYGHRGSVARGNHFMAHRTGFTARTLAIALREAGFGHVEVSHGTMFDLWAIAYLTMPPPGSIRITKPSLVLNG